MARVIRMLLAVALVLCWVTAAAQTGTQYLDAYIVQVKPEKRAEFDALSKRMADANRRNGGDQWLAMETMYGEANSVAFISTRNSYGDIDSAMTKFMGAASKAFGAGTEKLMNDFSSCLVSSRGEIRVRRWDLSWNAPKDAAEYAKLLGQSRYLRTNVVYVRPGRAQDFEAMVKELKAAREKNSPGEIGLVSQAVAGQKGGVFYITTLKPNMEAFDNVPTMQKIMGDEGFAKYMKTASDVVESNYTMINRFLPELSSAPPEVLAAGGEFWNPKPVVAEKKKGKPASKGEPGQ